MEIETKLHPAIKNNKMKKLLFITLVVAAFTAFKCNDIRHITGAVFGSDDKLPIPGAQVKINGSNTEGVFADKRGIYTIDISDRDSKLVFSFNGFKSKSISIGKTDTLNIFLDPDDNTLTQANSGRFKINKPHDEKTKPAGDTGNNNQLMELASPPYNLKKPGTGQSLNDYQNQAPVINSHVPNLSAQKNSGNRYDLIKKRPFLVKPYSGGNSMESYQPIFENSFNNPKEVPLSTFGIDVDPASYSNVRRFINSGKLPPANAVRVEEMINYFKYDLAAPNQNQPVAITTEVSSAPWNPNHRLVRVGLKARDIDNSQLPASNLVFLLDVSGSMAAPKKLPLVKTAMKMLVSRLRPQDRVAIVTYSGQAGVQLESTPCDMRDLIFGAIDHLQAGGSTAGAEGIKMAYAIARENYISGGNNRIIMATDGDFNIGRSSDGDMENLIIHERYSNVPITILGVGMGNLKDSKMEILADKGNGNYAYIDNLSEAKRALIDGFASTLYLVAKDVKLQVEFNPVRVQSYRLLGYEDRMLNNEDFNNDMKDAGDMGSGHTVTALYEIVPQGYNDEYSNNDDPLKYQHPKNKPASPYANELMTIKFRYKEPDSGYSKMTTAVVQDMPASFNSCSSDFRFASAVAEFGMLLRNSPFKQSANYEQVITIARNARGKDEDGYRSEFVRLAEIARSLAGNRLYTSNY